MHPRLRIGVATIVALALGAACGKDHTKTATPAQPEPHADSLDRFRELATDWIGAAKAGRIAELRATTSELRLPDAMAWFTATFGDEPANRLDAEYSQYFSELEQSLEGLINVVQHDHRDQIEVRRHTDPSDETATAYQVDALRAMKKPLALYTLQLRTAASTERLDRVTVWSFVHVDGKFRLVGKMKTLTPVPDDDLTNAIKELPVEDARKVLEER
jgi:hypothetical protein